MSGPVNGPLSPEEEFLLAKLGEMLAGFDDAPPAAVLRSALVRLKTQRPDEVAAALPELRAEVIGLLEAQLREGREKS